MLMTVCVGAPCCNSYVRVCIVLRISVLCYAPFRTLPKPLSGANKATDDIHTRPRKMHLRGRVNLIPSSDSLQEFLPMILNFSHEPCWKLPGIWYPVNMIGTQFNSAIPLHSCELRNQFSEKSWSNSQRELAVGMVIGKKEGQQRNQPVECISTPSSTILQIKTTKIYIECGTCHVMGLYTR